ncbi:hypothetical protein [Marinifilum sp. D737]|uniref:hypothetical protein n=1 Tax=Marinifilum sp. D737 TaxID=2969628 RepID=UPI00227651AC|nr:hypothetical protein [Marinifilum sp. D737]MCY1633607.1 hypothetical protein [Marinifilum sp. D737]
MKKILLILIIQLTSLISIAQINFKSGYFIDNNGKTIQCLIKDVGWKNNPTSFNYKINETAEVQSANINDVKEFSITESVHFIRYDVNIDRSSEILGKLSSNHEPKYNLETLFLKIIITGKATLYKYEDKDIIRFFYSINHSNPTQLVYKKYLSNSKYIHYNKSYKNQLLQNFKSSILTRESIHKINYKQKDLTSVFNAYNIKHDPNFTVNIPKEKDRFNFYLIAGIDQLSLSVKSINSTTNFGNKSHIKLSFEAEYILPFNNNKWSVFIAPSFVNYNATKEISIQTAKVDYKSLGLPVGLRYYLFFNKSKVHIDGLVSYNNDFNSEIKYSASQAVFEFEPNYNFGFGVGYDYKNLGSIEARYYTKRNLTNNAPAYTTHLENFSIILKIKVF